MRLNFLTALAAPATLLRDVRYPAIDGLRAYAVFIVFLSHTMGSVVDEYYRLTATAIDQGTEPWQRVVSYLLAGGNGVDVFFIISGFLMTKLVLDSKKFSYFKFLGQRVLRIYPAFLFSLALSFVCVTQLFGWDLKWPDLAANIIFLNAVPSLGVTPYNHVTWSLGYEFAFYLALPLIVPIARRTGGLPATLALLALAILFIPAEFLRMRGLAVGSVIGALSGARLERITRVLPLIPLTLAYLASNIVKPWLDFGSYYNIYLPLAALLFIKIAFGTNRLSRLFAWRPLRLIGTVSYSLYLLHSIVISLVLHELLAPVLDPAQPTLAGAALIIAASLLCTIVASYLSYLAFERFYFARRHRDAPHHAILAADQSATASLQ